MKNNKGLSLVEVLIAIIIMATMAGVVTVAYIKNVREAKESKVLSELKTVKTAVLKYYTQNGTWPVTTVWDSATSSSNIDSELKGYYYGSLDNSWGLLCQKDTGMYVEAYNLGADVYNDILPDWQQVCRNWSQTSDYTSHGYYLRCQIQSASDITDSSQCN